MWLVLGSDATCNTQRCEPDAFALHPEIWIDLKHMDHMDILRNIVKHPAFQGVRLEPPQKWMGGQRCWMHNQVRDIAKGFRQKTIDDVLPKNGAILCQSFALWIMKDLRSLTAIGQILSQMDWRFLCIFYCRCRCHFNFKVTTPILTLTPTERRFGSAVLFDLIATWYQAIQAVFVGNLQDPYSMPRRTIDSPILVETWPCAQCANISSNFKEGLSQRANACWWQRSVMHPDASRIADKHKLFGAFVIHTFCDFSIDIERQLTVCQTWSAHSRIQSWSQVAPSGRYTSSLGTQFSWQELAMKNNTNTANTVAVGSHKRSQNQPWHGKSQETCNRC